MIRIGSLFSGYGGLDLAVQSVLGGEIAWHVEYDKAPSRILDHHFPGVPNYGDVTKLDFTSVEPVDVITGGYPCQPFSHAGLRKGTNDERHLWPHVLRALRDLGPQLAVLENVRGHLSLGFDVVLSDLADIGWSAEWVVVRASDAGACHQRARLFILAYPENVGHEWLRSAWGRGAGLEDGGGDLANAAGDGRPQGWTGPGEWSGCCGQPACDCGAPADASQHGRDGCSCQPDSIGAGDLRRVSGQDTATVGDGRGPDVADATGPGRVRTPQHENDGADSGRGRRHDVADLGQGSGAAVADAIGGRRSRGAQQSQREPQRRTTAAGGSQDIPTNADIAGSQARGTEPDRAGRQQAAGQGQPVGGHAAIGRGCHSPDADLAGLEGRQSAGGSDMPSWGDYGPAIARWERVIGRSAPPPTEPGRTGAPRLAPRFVEWMMGLPDGWVTDPAIGISRNDQLKALGNGVVPQQAALALDVLLQRTSDDFRQTFAPL